MIDPKRLRDLAGEAIRRGEEEFQASATKKRELQSAQELAEMNRASGVVALIPELIQKATAKGRREELVMKIKEAELDRPQVDEVLMAPKDFFSYCQPSWLKGVARIVFHHCSQAGLKPMIRPCQSPDPDDSGFQIFISW